MAAREGLIRAEYPTVPLPSEPTFPVSIPRWIVALDTGGTFTDVVARTPNGVMRRVKVPSDGTILATLMSVESTTDATQTYVEAIIAPAAGLVLPNDLLTEWFLEEFEPHGTAENGINTHEAGRHGVEREIAECQESHRASAHSNSHESSSLESNSLESNSLESNSLESKSRLATPQDAEDQTPSEHREAMRERSEEDAFARVRSQRGNRLRFASALRPILAARVGTPVRFSRRGSRIDAARLGLHLVTETPLDAPLPPIEIRLSTTRGTNALLEGRGARVGVLVSKDLTGVVEIGDQTRENLFARVPVRTRQIAQAVRALNERSLAEGDIDVAAPLAEQCEAAAALRTSGCDSIVVSLAHALTNDREQEIASNLGKHGFSAVAARDIAPHPRLLTRTETACVHARIAPVLDDFVCDATKSASAPGTNTFVFTSAGILQPSNRFLARDTLYSGPAGGARAVASIARRHGIDCAVGFDMGGTSSDVSRAKSGEIAQRSESRLAGMTVAAPSAAVDSVAAGGGSLCRVRDGALEVGPESAGANPGPACYGRGGPLTVTDINLLSGRMATGVGAMSLDRKRAEEALHELSHERGLDPNATMDALLDIANARMALAIETLCVRDGVDPTGHTLIAFGGAGGQHACAIADRLKLDRIIFPRFAGFLCAEGVFAAPPARFATRTLLTPLSRDWDATKRAAEDAQQEATSALRRDGFTDAFSETVTALLRLAGQESSIVVPFATPDEMQRTFTNRFQELFGYEPPARLIEIVSVDVCVRADSAEQCNPECMPHTASHTPMPHPASHSATAVLMRSEGSLVEARSIHRSALATHEIIEGPAILTDAGETVVIDRSWRARLHSSGDLVAERVAPHAPRASRAEQELFAARIEAIAIAMGNVLERTALSPNIRDRLDFSCAILDEHGTLVQNAPHLPVHLGALGVCTRLVAQALTLTEGDIAVTNHPAFGGSHLPDVTTVAPVFIDGCRVAFVAVRAHHAEIGGTRPGSFPPDARTLEEEGVVLAPFLAVVRGKFDRQAARARFASGRFPSRNPDENVADLEAQIAATRYGMTQVAALARELGGAFSARCESELTRADRAMRRALERMSSDRFSATRRLDDGSAIAVTMKRVTAADEHRLSISFAGSASVHPANFNAPLAVTRAATLYVLRLLLDEPIPMNEGLLRSVDIDLPSGLLHPPFEADPQRCPPVVAGNVETSQSVVAALVAALGFAAESQSTMNNVLFGNDRFTVYETLGGGAGAGPTTDGASAVHVHMSNTRLTDIDVLERRAPVIIRRFMRRLHSGGHGARHGGDGIVRAYEFRDRVTLSFFASRRTTAPQGLEGGAAGACGDQFLERHKIKHHAIHGHDIERQRLNSVFSTECSPGDRFTVETPGGGGFGL